MAKTAAKSAPKHKTRRTPAAPKVLGTTYDGVRILKPRKPATHFTTAEIRRAIRAVLAAQRVG